MCIRDRPIVACVFLLYAVFGRQIPGVFRHAGFTVSKIIKLLYLTDEGIFGTALNTSATYVVLFIFFGAIMSEIGMSKFLSNLALALAGGSVGGPAKVSALASGLMGTVSGSTSANVATTGVMTIPLMKSVGYAPEYAGAVECVASAGGQIMPPVMGAAAFLMADVYKRQGICSETSSCLKFLIVQSSRERSPKSRSRSLSRLAEKLTAPLQSLQKPTRILRLRSSLTLRPGKGFGGVPGVFE